MKNTLCKATAVALAASFVFSLAACNKSGKSGSHGGRQITADMPWYDAKVIDFEPEYDKSREVDYLYTSLAGVDEEKIVLLTYGNYKMPTGNDVDWDNLDYSEYNINLLSVIDRASGETLKTLNFNDYFDADESPSAAVYHDGIITVNTTTWNPVTYDMTSRDVDFDLETMKILDTRDLGSGSQSTDKHRIGDVEIEATSHWNDTNSYITLKVKTPDNTFEDIEIKDEKEDIYNLSAILPTSDTEFTLILDVPTGNVFYTLDLKTGTVSKADKKDFDWVNTTLLYNAFNAPDGYVYNVTPAGISKIDSKKKVEEEIFNFSWCAVNRNILSNFYIAEVGENSFILCGEIYDSGKFTQGFNWNSSKFQIIEFTKAEKNPHAGKHILELFTSYGYTDDVMSDAIMHYNETNDKYFIEVTDRYKSGVDISYDEIHSDDEESELENNYYADMSNQLTMDIMNGEGPDMFLDVSHLNQLNNGNYLADLTPYVGNLDQNKYFTNIIDISKVDGKIYNLPVCFGITGIHTSGANAGASGIGFTTEEYEKFLHDTLNGEDVISNGQAYYFTKLFNSMRDKFISNGKVDFTGPEFAELAEFVKNNVQENSKTWAEGEYGNNVIVYGGPIDEEIKKAVYTTSYGFYDYFMSLNQLDGADAILGIPSSDGRGPEASPYTSIAISAQAYDVDACGEFVKYLLSDEVQNKYADLGNFVLSRDAFRNTGAEAIKYFNENNINTVLYGAMYYGEDIPENRVKYTEEHIDTLEGIITNCSIMYAEDGEINKVLCEEMPAYFSGQKELSEVVAIAQERVQKILNERG